VGIAFGLAADTFTNISSRLLLEVNHSTVQSVVLGYQADFRAKNLKVIIDNRPAAIYLLRSYLRLCMPYSIETSIKNTVTIYHRDPTALNTEPLLLRTPVASRLQTAYVLYGWRIFLAKYDFAICIEHHVAGQEPAPAHLANGRRSAAASDAASMVASAPAPHSAPGTAITGEATGPPRLAGLSSSMGPLSPRYARR
jgi:hypothetical protein